VLIIGKPLATSKPGIAELVAGTKDLELG